ncbi:MAG: UDP-N-acetylglucosamine 1-carboxyvinyltransferase [Patescibacteria group bacterium]
MSDEVKIIGGRPLKGSVNPIPNKNSLVAVLPAAILTDDNVIYNNIPNTTDITKILQILKLLGADIIHKKKSVIINCKKIKSFTIDPKLGGEFRASLLFAGPLLARFGRAVIPMPGGCLLGFRSLSSHIDAFKRIGVKIKLNPESIDLTAPKKPAKKYHLWQMEASVTATENLLMYAAGVNTQISITEAACEPHVVDLQNLLISMGTKINGIGSNKLAINGNNHLKGTEFTPRPDFVDIAGFMVAAAVTNGCITIKNSNIPDIVDGIIHWMEMFGISIQRKSKDLIVKRKNKKLQINTKSSGFPTAAPGLPKLAPRPWPGFPVDLIPVIATLASKTEGKLLLQNWMYESGFDFVRELNSLGADIFVSTPQRVIVNGPVKFKGGEVTPPQVIQAAKAIFLASLCDPVETTIHGFSILKRRYPNIIDVYRSLGAKIY